MEQDQISNRLNDGPEGELVLQDIAMPGDANAYGDIFGGWLLSKMDLGGSVLAHQRAQNRVTTVAIENMMFLKPVFVGDLVCCYAHTLKTGRTSITIQIEVWVVRMRLRDKVKVAEGVFIYVALDEHLKPKPIDWNAFSLSS